MTPSGFALVTNSGLARANGLLVEAWGRIFALGGDQHSPLVAERIGNAWQEPLLPLPQDFDGAGWAASTYDFDREAYVYHGPNRRTDGILGHGFLEWPRDAGPRTFPGPTPERSEAPLSWDPASGKSILYGGRKDNEVFGDLWTWDGSNAERVSTGGEELFGGTMIHAQGRRYLLKTLDASNGPPQDLEFGAGFWKSLYLYTPTQSNMFVLPGSGRDSVFARVWSGGNNVDYYEALPEIGSGFTKVFTAPSADGLPLPWRSSLLALNGTNPPRLHSTSTVEDAPFARALTRVNPFFLSPAPQRRAVLFSGGVPGLELNDEPRPGFALRYLNDFADLDVTLCARSTRGARTEPHVLVFVADQGMVRRLPPGRVEGDCELYEVRLERASRRVFGGVWVIAPDAPLTETVGVEIDQLLVTTTEIRN